MDNINLTTLQLQIENLIHSRTQLRTENKILREKLTHTMRTRATLANKLETTSQKLKSIIHRIKEEMP